MSEQSSTGNCNMPKVGEVCWLEIPASDMARGQQFYKTIFGWEFKSPGPECMAPGAYALFSKPDTKLCGGMPLVKAEELVRPTLAQASNRIVMVVDEVTAALKSIEAAGGEIVCGKREIGPDMGFSGRFRDTEGNINGVWSKN